MLVISYREHNRNEYEWQQFSILFRSSYCQQLNVASYHGSAMCVVIIRCRRSYIVQVTVNGRHRRERSFKSWLRTTSMNERASWCRYCCGVRRPAVDGRPSQWRHCQITATTHGCQGFWLVTWLIDWSTDRLTGWLILKVLPGSAQNSTDSTVNAYGW